MDSPSPLYYLLVVVLLCFSAFFSSSETAVSTANKLRLKKSAEEGDKRAGAALKICAQYDWTLFAILIGNNVVNIASSAVATLLATALFGLSGAAVATLVMTVLVLTFGEIIPKSYAGDHADRLILTLARPLRVFVVAFTPISWLFMQLKNLLVPSPKKSPTVTEEELLFMLESIEEEGVIEEQEKDLVQSALEFDEITIREIITPRVDMVAIDVDEDPETIMDLVLSEGYSRIPVYEENIDNIIGILFTRDWLRSVIKGEEADLRQSLGEPLFVHRTMKVSQLLARLKARQMKMAVVTDDYGGTLGIVTMEDVLEELVGDIWDEDDEAPVGLIELERPGCFEVPGSYSLRDLFEETGLEAEEPDSDYSTVGGWALHLFEHIPAVGESLEQAEMTLTILEMDGHRIRRLRLELHQAPEEGEEEENLLTRIRDRAREREKEAGENSQGEDEASPEA